MATRSLANGKMDVVEQEPAEEPGRGAQQREDEREPEDEQQGPRHGA